MSKLFVVRNQHGYYLSKQLEWLTGEEPKLLYKTLHADEALNTLIEVNSKDISLRGEVLEVAMGDKGLPAVEAAPPQTRAADEQAEQALEQTVETEGSVAAPAVEDNAEAPATGATAGEE